jgi:hypothetical protein
LLPSNKNWRTAVSITDYVIDILLIGAAVVWVLARQARLARIKPRLLWLAPLILAYFGIRGVPASTWHVPADLGLLALSAAISLGLGVWRGQTIMVWRDIDGTWWRQGSARTLVLWGALIVARALLYGLDAAAGHREASGLGAILLTLALSFAAQNSVTALRMHAVPQLPGGQPAESAAHRAMAVPSRGRARDRIYARHRQRRLAAARLAKRNWSLP